MGRTDRATRVAFLIDGEAYYAALADALASARHSIRIVGWDIHSRVRLRPDDERSELAALLDGAARRHETLRAYVLSWDFAAIYSIEREFLTAYRFGWNTHPRVRFELDGRHPAGACHHQKIVTVDDRLAFVGGFDLTARRWDRSSHAPDEPGRVDPDGTPYDPFHDVQAVVAGPAAQRLAGVARERWRRATGESLEATPAGSAAADWPCGLDAVRDVEVGLALTEGACDGRPPVHEIETLYLDAIAAAERWIYIENQFLTSSAVADALEARLATATGPEVVIVRPRELFSWLETATMGVLADRVVRRLQAADRHGRLGVYYPHRADLGDRSIGVHSKVCVIDDAFLTVGSANLSNRSMRLDSECSLYVDASAGAATARLSAELRNRLLGEHLGCEPASIEDALSDSGSLLRTIESLRGGERTLNPLQVEASPVLDAVVPDGGPIDPERPVGLDAFLRLLAGR